MCLILRSKYFHFSQIEIYILKLHLYTWIFDYMIPKGFSHTSVQNPTYQKRNISSIQENISSIQNYQGLSFFRSLLLVWQSCSLNWDLDIDSFVGIRYISFDGPVAKYLLVMQGARDQIQCVVFIPFSWWHPWEPRFKSGFLNSFWDYLVPDRI